MPSHIGTPFWNNDLLKSHLEEFSELYKQRPGLDDNEGGMQSSVLYFAWFLAKELKPTTIIESGVWKGMSTWFFEQACPEAVIYSIDPCPQFRSTYTSKKVIYLSSDMITHNWRSLVEDKENTLCIIDDHQNDLKRLQYCSKVGFKHVFLEDNYPPNIGDCYSIKKAFCDKTIVLNNLPIYYQLNNLIEVYAEFPPVFKSELTRWGDRWDSYDTEEPLYTKIEAPYLNIYHKEVANYTWPCYVKLV
jgi:hypothetical protein